MLLVNYLTFLVKTYIWLPCYLLRVELPLYHLHEVVIRHCEGHVHLPAVWPFMQGAAALPQIDGCKKEDGINHQRFPALAGFGCLRTCLCPVINNVFGQSFNVFFKSLLNPRPLLSKSPVDMLWRRPEEDIMLRHTWRKTS